MVILVAAGCDPCCYKVVLGCSSFVTISLQPVVFKVVHNLASSPGGKNDRLVHTVMRMRLISEESWKIVYSCPRLQNGSTEGDLN